MTLMPRRLLVLRIALHRLAAAAVLGAVVAAALATTEVYREGWLELSGWWRLAAERFWHHADRWAPGLAAVWLVVTTAHALLRRRLPATPPLAMALTVLALLSALRLLAVVGLPVRQRPNVVLISIDTLRADRLGAYGYLRPTTPRLDSALAAEGVTFERVFANAPKTTPSHMSMLTSLPPCAHGVLMWEGSDVRAVLNPRVHTLAEVLRAAGYTTAAFTGGGPMDRSRGFAQGFATYRHGRQLERAIAWLDRRPATRPFFLFLHTFEVHDPYTPPPSQIARFLPDYQGPVLAAVEQIRAGTVAWHGAHRLFWEAVDRDDPRAVDAVARLYDGAIREMDDNTLTALLRYLDDRGLASETLVIFTSDHGEAFGEHGAFLHDDLYEGTLRVPLVLRFPGILPAGRRLAEPAQLLDLLPTVLELLDIPLPPGAQGRSFALAARGTGPAPPAAAIVSEHASPTTGWRATSLRLGTLAFFDVGGTPMLFDLASDPAERHDVAARDPGQLAELRGLLAGWHSECAQLAARFGPRGSGIAPSPDALRRLRALGYVE